MLDVAIYVHAKPGLGEEAWGTVFTPASYCPDSYQNSEYIILLLLLSVISYQLSVINYQLSVTSYQLQVITYPLSVICYDTVHPNEVI